jgi:hypothetical protein
MARKKMQEPEQRTALIIQKDEFKAEAETFLQNFADINGREIRNENELSESERDTYELIQLVDEFLKGSFNKPYNEHRHDFENAGRFIGIDDVMRRADTSHLGYRINKHKELIESKMSTIKVLQAKIKYIPSAIEQGTGFNSAANFSEEEKRNVNVKIDEVLSELHKLHLGQEIIFDEIEQLRELLTLDKKNWKQNLKGKLLDMGLSKLLEKEMLEWIYRTLTGDSLSLLK